MDKCDVLIAGGGPAGSACAWSLRRSGLDVLVLDKATFPRDKVCAGWITPPVLTALRVDPEQYASRRTFQPLTGFRVGLIGEDDFVDVNYAHPVSFGIRRCEFDEYLLRRSRARLQLGQPVASIRRDGARWIVNGTVSASMLVGAGGHGCPVARTLNERIDRAPLIAAQEVECEIDSRAASSFAVAAERPELYFCRDFKGYGWCFRKEGHLNVGFGRLDPRALPRATLEFVGFLKRRGKIPVDWSPRWRGHAYLLAGPGRRTAVGDGVLLAGDAAGLAYAQSGEGIRPAIESGLLAATTIVEANGDYSSNRLIAYEERLRKRFGVSSLERLVSLALPEKLSAVVARRAIGSPSVVRHVVLDRWFLHR